MIDFELQPKEAKTISDFGGDIKNSYINVLVSQRTIEYHIKANLTPEQIKEFEKISIGDFLKDIWNVSVIVE